MTDIHQLPFLLRLLDDPSTNVQTGVLDALSSFGDELDELLRGLDEAPSDEQRAGILTRVAAWRDGGGQAASRTEAARTPPDAASAQPARIFDGIIVEPQALFDPGDLVRHRRYDYRGVIVELDDQCMADKRWYQSNKTQPPRDQPWYHVLVDGSPLTTYTAQTSLVKDTSEEQIRHPLVPRFFSGFVDGRYERNNRPWM